MRSTAFNEARSSRTRMQVLALASLSLLTGMVLHATLLAPRSHSIDGAPGRSDVQRDETNAAATAKPVVSAPHMEHGVSAGFDRTTDGAVAAAAAYVCTGQAML